MGSEASEDKPRMEACEKEYTYPHAHIYIIESLGVRQSLNVHSIVNQLSFNKKYLPVKVDEKGLWLYIVVFFIP